MLDSIDATVQEPVVKLCIERDGEHYCLQINTEPQYTHTNHITYPSPAQSALLAFGLLYCTARRLVRQRNREVYKH